MDGRKHRSRKGEAQKALRVWIEMPMTDSRGLGRPWRALVRWPYPAAAGPFQPQKGRVAVLRKTWGGIAA
jgi:hypothetical protein